MTAQTRLTLHDVSHAYGKFIAARHVGLSVASGQVHCLLGPSGSGKSTLLRLVAGLERLQSGRITIDDRLVAAPGMHIQPEERSVGFVFQDYALFPHLNVLKNVIFGMIRRPKKEQRQAALALLDQVGMADYAEAMPHTLSGGQQQRVALARALAPEPRIMLLDEPFSGLDVQLREEVRDATLGLLRSTGVATLMVTHDPREALNTGDVISVIRQGRIIQTGDPDEVYRRSADPEVAKIFGPINILSARVKNRQADTPFGPLDAPYDDGTVLDLIIRPESFHLESEPTPNHLNAQVTSTFTEGGTVLVGLQLDGPESASGLEIRALSLERRSWKIGDRAYVGLDKGAVLQHPRR